MLGCPENRPFRELQRFGQAPGPPGGEPRSPPEPVRAALRARGGRDLFQCSRVLLPRKLDNACVQNSNGDSFGRLARGAAVGEPDPTRSAAGPRDSKGERSAAGVRIPLLGRASGSRPRPTCDTCETYDAQERDVVNPQPSTLTLTCHPGQPLPARRSRQSRTPQTAAEQDVYPVAQAFTGHFRRKRVALPKDAVIGNPVPPEPMVSFQQFNLEGESRLWTSELPPLCMRSLYSIGIYSFRNIIQVTILDPRLTLGMWAWNLKGRATGLHRQHTSDTVGTTHIQPTGKSSGTVMVRGHRLRKAAISKSHLGCQTATRPPSASAASAKLIARRHETTSSASREESSGRSGHAVRAADRGRDGRVSSMNYHCSFVFVQLTLASRAAHAVFRLLLHPHSCRSRPSPLQFSSLSSSTHITQSTITVTTVNNEH